MVIAIISESRSASVRNRDRHHLGTLIGIARNTHPMPLALLKVANGQLRELMPTKSTGEQKGKQRPITFTLHLLRSGACQSACPCSAVNQLPSLTPSFFTPLTRRIPAAKSALRSPQSAASYARRRTAPRRRLIVPGSEIAGFQMHSVPDDHRLAERQPRLGAIPLHEFVNRMPIAALGIGTGKAVEDSGFRDFEVWQPQDRFRARRFSLRLVFAS